MVVDLQKAPAIMQNDFGYETHREVFLPAGKPLCARVEANLLRSKIAAFVKKQVEKCVCGMSRYFLRRKCYQRFPYSLENKRLKVRYLGTNT